MFIIFGTRALKHTIDQSPILKNSCPNCSKGNLIHKKYRRWFTLFFIPVIPLDELDRYYECDKCNSGYQENIKQILHQSQQELHNNQTKAKTIFAQALIASMTHMALIDDDYAEEEEREINDMISKFPDYTTELNAIHAKVKANGNKDNYVFNFLIEARDLLSSEALMNLLAQAGIILLADGSIDKREEELMKDFLVACGLPKEFYPVLIDKLKVKEVVSDKNLSMN